MTQVWLQSNRRVLLLALVPVGLLLGVSVALLNLGFGPVVKGGAWVGLFFSLLLILGLVAQFRRPRVAYREGEVLFYMRTGSPIAVPIEVVEAFFLGQGPANLPVQVVGKAESVNLIARLSRKAKQWEQQSVKCALGSWTDSYVTIRGTWCEPLNGEVVRRLNRLLAEASAANRGVAKSGESK